MPVSVALVDTRCARCAKGISSFEVRMSSADRNDEGPRGIADCGLRGRSQPAREDAPLGNFEFRGANVERQWELRSAGPQSAGSSEPHPTGESRISRCGAERQDGAELRVSRCEVRRPKRRLRADGEGALRNARGGRGPPNCGSRMNTELRGASDGGRGANVERRPERRRAKGDCGVRGLSQPARQSPTGELW